MSVSFQLRAEDNQPTHTPFVPFPTSPRIPDNDINALITDVFNWLETDWQLPVFTKEAQWPSLPPPPIALTKKFYTRKELRSLYGYSKTRVGELLREYGGLPMILGSRGRAHAYRKQDLTPLIERWNLKQLLQTLDNWWRRFFHPACGTCTKCQIARRDPFTMQVRCLKNGEIDVLRSVFGHFLGEVQRLGSVTAWWRDYHVGAWSRSTSSAWGILFIYLLDRRLIHLSNDELLQLKPIRNKGNPGMARLWRNRRPEEYQQFRRAMKATNYQSELGLESALRVMSLFVLLKYGLPGVTELGRRLSSKLYVCTFWSSSLKLREVRTKHQVQCQIGIAHEASRADVVDGDAGFHAAPPRW